MEKRITIGILLFMLAVTTGVKDTSSVAEPIEAGPPPLCNPMVQKCS